MRVYISGPMSGLPDYNFPAFNAAAINLLALGYTVENPADKGVIDGWDWAQYLKYDLIKLVECDGILLLPGWRKSNGARLEYYVAKKLGLERVRIGGK